MTSVLTLQNVHKTFEAKTPNENHVLKGIDLKVEKGDFITIIGGNGAGKSTFLNAIAGSLLVDQGTIKIDRKSTRLNSSHVSISYAVFCLHKKQCILKRTYLK